MRKIYLAGPFSWQKRIKQHALELERLGYLITAQWLDQEPKFTKPDNSTVQSEQTWSECQHLSVRDIENIFEADTLILFEPGIAIERNTRVAEFGGALFTGRQCVVIQPPFPNEKVISNIFVKLHHQPSAWQYDDKLGRIKPVLEFPSWEDFIADISDPVEIELCSGCGRDCGGSCPAGTFVAYQSKAGLRVQPPKVQPISHP